MSLILGIESSCDECSASVVRSEPGFPVQVLSVSTFSQVQIHRPYGGVVPEIASRNHLETMNPMIDQAIAESGVRLSELDAIAVTHRPGLVGALLVGVSAAKALAYALDKPLIPVHHLEGHASSLYLEDWTHDPAQGRRPLLEKDRIPTFPLLLAVISGGHTNLYQVKESPDRWPVDFLKKSLIGKSRDDAAGEAFDKTAKILGFPYPGGVWIDRTAQGGNPGAFSFPRALPQKSTYDFSFSGLKTAVALQAEKLRQEKGLEACLPDLCASIQEAIVDALLRKIFLAVESFHCETVAIVGGVAANSRLRSALEEASKKVGLKRSPIFPHLSFCTDNAAMIAGAGAFRFHQGQFLNRDEYLTLNAIANPEL